MPIGKNALKRVTNNGYSNVKATAPDMENSVVVTEAPAPEVKAELKEVATVKVTPKKNTAPKTRKAPTPKPKTEKAEYTRPDGFVKYGLGKDLPEYLL